MNRANHPLQTNWIRDRQSQPDFLSRSHPGRPRLGVLRDERPQILQVRHTQHVTFDRVEAALDQPLRHLGRVLAPQ